MNPHSDLVSTASVSSIYETGVTVPSNESTKQFSRVASVNMAVAVTTSLDGILFMDDSGRVIDLNPAAERILGLAPGEAIAAKLVELILPAELAEKQTQWLARYFPPNDDVLREQRVEIPAKRADGQRITLELAVTLDPDSDQAVFIVFIRDITERIRNEERLRLLESVAVHARDSILITDAEPIDEPGPRIIYVNEAFTRLTGYTPQEVIGKTPRILQGPNTSIETREKIRNALKSWKPILIEVLNYRKDGSEFWEELSIVPVADKTGWYTHWVSIQRDITERKEAEAVVHKAKEEAERANQAKNEFLSRMSHELRTPLNAILGFAQLLEEDAVSSGSRESVHQILTAGRHLLGLINEVLDIARIEAGRLALSLEPVCVADALHEVVNIMRPLSAQRRITLQYDDCPNYVLADRQRIKQVLLNLISNAIKYNREAGMVTVACTAVSKPDPESSDQLRIAISDTGPGIAPDRISKLFVPFERLGAENLPIEGIGLGLALSKRLTELMSGRIGATSAVGVGSTFWLELPLTESPLQRSHFCDSDPDAPISPVSPSAKVLYIEDNLSNLRLVQRVLQRRPQVKLIAAMNGELGLAAAREHRPNAILLDLHLPDMHGQQVLEQLLSDELTARIPIIVISADATPSQVERLLAGGADSYLTKPIDISQFITVLDNTLRLPQAGPSALN